MIDEIVAAGAVQSGTNENSQRPGQHRMEEVTATKYGQYALSYRLESRSLYLDLVAVTFSFLLFLSFLSSGPATDFQRWA